MQPTIAMSLLAALVMAPACAVDGAESEAGDCEALAAELDRCGSTYDGFSADCAADPDAAAAVVVGACSGDKGDSSIGWREEGERCFEFNFECTGGLVCRPLNADESDSACLPPAAPGGLCDDHDDCEGTDLCDEPVNHVGVCRPDPEINPFCSSAGVDECPIGLACRPAVAGSLNDSYCLPPGGEGELCWDDAGCLSDLTCMHIADNENRCSPVEEQP